MTSREKVHTLVEGAIMVAMAAALSFVKISIWADGGSVDLVMIPIVIFAVRHGLGWGLGAGLVYGVIDFLLGGRAMAWQAIFLDYFAAFTMFGLAGIFKGRKNGIIWGSILAGLGRFVFHYISGIVVWGEWMPEEFFGMTMTTPAFYSLLYNGSYMAANIIIAVVMGVILTKLLDRYLPVKSRAEKASGK